MKIFEPLLKEIEDKNSIKEKNIDELESFVREISTKLLDERFYPSEALKKLLDKFMRRVKYPMEVAIVGQFSSGKSTFLNALLSKDVLPTGITPVTSKVNFLNYADEYKVEVTYSSGAKEFQPIEFLAKFTDQRETLADIKYLSLFAPVELLKEISFVDTPGFNSQSKFDTGTTTKVLRDVDGIIWLGLIDAVAKKSELDILEEYLPNYANKSICLLNQKDRLRSDEVEIALEYAKQNYKDYFSEIIAISAKEALDSRIHQKENLLFDEKNRFAKDIRDCILHASPELSNEFFNKKLELHNKNIETIRAADYSKYTDGLKTSNITKVLEFIDNTLRAKAKESKMFAIKKDLSSVIEILQNEYTRITTIYAELAEIIEELNYNVESKIIAIQEERLTHVEMLNIKINEVISSNVSKIYTNIKSVEKYLAKDKKTLLGTTCNKIKYQSYELIESKLDLLEIKVIQASTDDLVDFAQREIRELLNNFEKELILWKLKAQKMIKNREIASDLEFYEVKYFASGIYELIFTNYTNKFHAFKAQLINKVNKFSFKTRFELAYEKTTSWINSEIISMQNAYEKDSLNSVINSIDESEILLKFKENLDFDYLKRELQKGNSFVKSALDNYLKEISNASKESITNIDTSFGGINEKVKSLDYIKSTF